MILNDRLQIVAAIFEENHNTEGYFETIASRCRSFAELSVAKFLFFSFRLDIIWSFCNRLEKGPVAQIPASSWVERIREHRRTDPRVAQGPDGIQTGTGAKCAEATDLIA